MELDKMRVRLTLIDEMLGTASGDPKLHEEFIASKAPDALSREEEVAFLGVEESIKKDKTIFPRDADGDPIMWNYQIKGFFKSACGGLRRFKGTESVKVKAYKKIIDLNIFVFADANDPSNRAIKIQVPDGGIIGDCQRPLRAQTAQGDRVALANSETVPKGSKLEFDICAPLGGTLDRDLLKEWLDFGAFNGLGQWRNSGKGAFFWEELVDGKTVDGNLPKATA